MSGSKISEIITRRQKLGIGGGNEIYDSMKIALQMVEVFVEGF